MPFQIFDRSKLCIMPLGERVHDIDIETVSIQPGTFTELSQNRDYDSISDAIIRAKESHSTVLMMYGAHVIRKGNSLYMIELMKRGFVTHFATNGAGAIHDFEFSMIGQTCESVARYISEGQFGLWKETGYLNDAVNAGVKEGLGFGEAVGKYIWENDFPNKERSVLAMGYHLQVPCTVHIGIGNDIVHEHPNFDGAAAGEASYRDFLIYTKSIENLNHGVFLNFGSAVTGPEVYLKALAMARNAAKQEDRDIYDITTAVFDLKPIKGDTSHEPAKTDPYYYYRPWKTILARTVADGGRSFYICDDHAVSVPNIGERLLRRGDI
ncbi:hypothetical protein SAMN02910369_00257 [Lachnospiraceae bacterium NE2001]|nr:hypothetical protein SAMN02910369_00257 [Lachnospiraceae bacterium NE2001]